MRIYFLLAASLSIAPSWCDDARDARIRQDLQYVADQIVAHHPNPFTKISRADFNARRQSISDAIPSLNDVSAYLRIHSLAASIGDAHTSVGLDTRFYQTLGVKNFPIQATLYDDGLFITFTEPSYTQYLGRRVVSINGRTPEQIIEAARPFISYDNEPWLRQQFIALTRAPQLLNAIGLGEDPETAVWVLQDLAGRRDSITLPGTSPVSGVQVNDPAFGYLSPTYSDLNLNYWYRYYPEQKLLFFKYNVCNERADLPFSTFSANLMRDLDAQPVESLVVDLRDNTGGNSEVWRPFLNALQTRYTRLRQNPRFGFYGLISRLTFSSGMFAAQEIKRFAGALLVGEPTGGNPLGFGNVLPYTLPNSGLRMSISSQLFSPFGPGVTPPAVAPDIRVYRDSADVFARFDPILFAVFALKDGRPLSADRDGAVVSAASLRAGSVHSPGSLATVFGDFTGVVPAAASTIPLPETLSDVRVFVGGKPAPLLYVGPSQVNFQQPAGPFGVVETVEVHHADRTAIAMWKATETICPAAPAIFVSDSTNFRRPGAVLNQDGGLNTATRPARSGEIIQIFATGYSELEQEVRSGDIPAKGTVVRTKTIPTVLLGQWSMEVLFSGASPEFPGLWQINAKVPQGAAGGRLLPLAISVAGQLSPAVSISVE